MGTSLHSSTAPVATGRLPAPGLRKALSAFDMTGHALSADGCRSTRRHVHLGTSG